MGSSFVHLHVHTEYSMLDGAAKVGPLFDEVARLEQPAVAISDHGNMFGSDSFYQQSTKHPDIKPIIGIEAYLAPHNRFHTKPVFWGDTQGRRDENGEGGDVAGAGAFTHMTMWAYSATGLRNLFRLSTLASTQGYYRKPRMDLELIAESPEGIIATTGCPSGAVSTRLRLGQFDEAVKVAAECRDIFGAGNYYVELMDHGLSIERNVRADLLAVAKKLNLPVVATNDSHYVTIDQSATHDALLCVQVGKTMNDPNRFKFDGDGYYLKSSAEMRDYWDKELPGAADATLLIAERVESYKDVFDHKDRMPIYKPPMPTLHDVARDVLNAKQISDVSAVHGARPLILRVEASKANERQILAGLGQQLSSHQGDTTVCVVLCDDIADVPFVVEDYSVALTPDLMRALNQLDGVTVA